MAWVVWWQQTQTRYRFEVTNLTMEKSRRLSGGQCRLQGRMRQIKPQIKFPYRVSPCFGHSGMSKGDVLSSQGTLRHEVMGRLG